MAFIRTIKMSDENDPENDQRVPEGRNPQYLGDAVYVCDTGYGVALSVNDHRNAPVVYLEPKVLDSLFEYYKTLT